jgi:Flp pilus assembly protein TadD
LNNLLFALKENEIALCNLGCLMFCRGDMESAEDLFSRRLKVSMADFRALCNRAHARLKRGNFVGALEDYLALRLHYPASVSQDMVDGIRTQVITSVCSVCLFC